MNITKKLKYWAQNNSYLFTVTVIFFLQILKAKTALKSFILWAEDSTHFFKESLELDYYSLFTPIIGHHHLIPRIIAYLSSKISLYYTPQIYLVSAVLISSLSLAVFSRKTFRWIVQNDFLRICCCIFFSLTYGAYEVIYSLSMLNYVIFTAILLLLLEKDSLGKFSLSLKKSLFISFLWFSAGQSILTAPLILFLYYLTKNKNYIFLLLTLAISLFLNVLSVNQNLEKFPLNLDPWLLMIVYLTSFFYKYFLLVIFGSISALILDLFSSSVLITFSLGFISLVIFLFLKKIKDLDSRLLLSLAFLINFLAVITVATRPYGLYVIFSLFHRTCFIFSVINLILIIHFTEKYLKKRVSSFALNIIYLMLFLNSFGIQIFPRRAFSPERINEWKNQVTNIEQILQSQHHHPIHLFPMSNYPPEYQWFSPLTFPAN